MKKTFVGLIISLTFFAFSVFAHPLGNFSVNQFSRVEVEKSEIKVRSILDLAEIPTFQLKSEIDTDKNGIYSQGELDAYAEKITPQHISNLHLSVDGNEIPLAASSKKINIHDGEGSMPLIRVEWNLTAVLPPEISGNHRVKFENKNYAERIGWNEIVVGRTSGVNVFDSTAKGSGLSDELKTYPQESLIIPLEERRAEFSFTANAIPANASVLQNRDGHTTAAVQKDKFAELVNIQEITPSVILFGLFLAFGFGAMHAMSPGHGKTVVGAYLVGSRGTIKHAVFLGLTVTITHTLGVFALGLITLFASNYILPEKMMPFLGFVSGLLVFFIGVSLFKDRLFSILGWKTASGHHGHDHAHDHENLNEGHDDHAHDGLTHTHGGSTHTHLPPQNVTWKNLLALGISGGLLPCPSALVLMLSAISIGRIGYGLLLTLVFSFGLAATLTAVGLIFLYVGKAFGGSRLSAHPVAKAVPVFSAFVIAFVGAMICYSSL